MENLEDDDSFAEEERVLDFGEEDDVGTYNPSQQHRLFKEYEGEDFSKYLQEDDYDPMTADVVVVRDYDDDDHTYDEICTDSYSTQRKHSSGQIQTQESPDSSEISSYSAKSQNSVDLNDGKTKSNNTIKGRLGKLFAKTKSQKQNGKSDDNNRNKIYNFSFADSKIGNSLAMLEQEQQTRVGANLGAGSEICDSGIGLSDGQLEVQSDIGLSNRSSWWSIGTLSARSNAVDANAAARSEKDIKTKNRRSKSIPFLTDSRSDISSTPFSIDKQADMNESESKGNKVGNVWKKMSDTIKRKSGIFEKESVTVSPLSCSSTSQTIRL